jgi:hypothetical protein
MNASAFSSTVPVFTPNTNSALFAKRFFLGSSWFSSSVGATIDSVAPWSIQYSAVN